ncbi:hypothetical protein [Natronorarus salvus]|uniref:hypothetical protein n=1 Tax=Natronorarus salvus TaxID=3117733 RepID=UPI002F267DCD
MRRTTVRTVATAGAVLALLAALAMLASGELLIAGLCCLLLSLSLYVRETKG